MPDQTDIPALIAELKTHPKAQTRGSLLDLVNRAADALESLTAERDKLGAEARKAHDDLTWLAVELGWATDGRLSVAVGHVKELVTRLLARAEIAKADLAAAQAVIAAVQALLPGPRTFAESLTRDYNGNLFPRMVDADRIAAVLSRSPLSALRTREAAVLREAVRTLEKDDTLDPVAWLWQRADEIEKGGE